jgi:hypothetical protein
MRWHPVLLAWLVAASISGAATITEDFSTNPLQNGWQEFGDTNLFQWDDTNDDLAVTWDSSQTNSYFCHPLGTILARSDDFSLAFDLQLTDAEAGGMGFELAVGFLNLAKATGTNFIRGTAKNSPDLVELDYFPATALFDSTTWPIFVDTNSSFNYNGPSDYAIYGPNLDDWYHVVMTYTSSNLEMVTTITNFEQTDGVTIMDPLNLTSMKHPFSDFRVDTISINSYSGAGSQGSILAHGLIDNIVVTLPPPPVQNLSGTLNSGVWSAGFLSRSNWMYTLQRTTDFQSWAGASAATPGNGATLALQDSNAPAGGAFYRVSATRP